LEEKERVDSRKLLNKTVVSKSGKMFGKVGDLVFETKTGEIIYLVLDNATPFAANFELEKDDTGRYLVPFNAVIAVGDLIVVAEEDIV